LSVKGTDVKQKSNMNNLRTFGNLPLINGETFGKMERVQTYLKEQGVKPVMYDTLITNCSSCGGWSSKQKCNG